MVYSFEADIQAAAGKLSREDRNEIRDYLGSVRIDAAEADKAVKALAKKLQGRINGAVIGGEADISLPDYGCHVRVKAHEEA